MATISSTYDIVVVGAGHAGMRAIEGVRSVTADATLLLVGAENHLPYERPPLSKAVLGDFSKSADCIKHDAQFYSSNRVKLILGDPAVQLNCAERKIRLASGEVVTYAKLVLATGSRPRRLQNPKDFADRVFYLRTLDDAQRLSVHLSRGKRIGVIGAGFIGLEVAATAVDLGCQVTVFEASRKVLARTVPASVALLVQQFHEARGVQFILGASPDLAAGSEAVSVAVKSLGQRWTFDALVVGIGVLPNKEIAQSAGLVTDDGILVDACGRTSDAHVLAAGEVTQHPLPGVSKRVRRESWQVAENQAYNAGRTAGGAPTETMDIPWFWSDQSTLNMQVVGHLTPESDIASRGDFASGIYTGFALSDGKVIGAVALNAARDISAARRLISTGQRVSLEALCDPGRAWREIMAA